ncbi:MAG: hypothetical protein GWN00_22815 [Aliifodinibius sp.]|nr:hypothetical protein [Fodinibius sp.]NIY27532.1 hypothetical protein [Fodinibius sp.]
MCLYIIIMVVIACTAVTSVTLVNADYSLDYAYITILNDNVDPDEMDLELGDEIIFTFENLGDRNHTVILREATNFNFTLYAYESYEFTLIMNFEVNTVLHFDITNCAENFQITITEYVPPKFKDDHASLTLVITLGLCVVILIIGGIVYLTKQRKERRLTSHTADGEKRKEFFNAGHGEIHPDLLREIQQMRGLKGKPSNAEEIGAVLDTSIVRWNAQITDDNRRANLIVRDALKFIIATNRQLTAQNRHLAGRIRDLEIEQEGFYNRMEKVGDSIVIAGGIDLSAKPLNWSTGFKRVWDRYKFLFIGLGLFILLIILFLLWHFIGKQEDGISIATNITRMLRGYFNV